MAVSNLLLGHGVRRMARDWLPDTRTLNRREPDLRAEFLAICDAGCNDLATQVRAVERKGRAFYWDSYLVRGLCVAYDITGKQSYLDAARLWSDRMLEYQKEMIPAGAYYMQYGRRPGESQGSWYVADCSSIALGVLATSIRCSERSRRVAPVSAQGATQTAS